MALNLSGTIAAELAKKAIRLAPLLMFDFASGPARYWIGKGILTTGGFSWSGLPIIVSIDFGKLSVNGAAEQFSLNVSGVDATFLGKVQGVQSECIGRTLQIWFQFFDEHWQPLDPPFQVRSGRMLGLSYRAAGVGPRSITVQCESKFTARGMAPGQFLSDREMKARFPGNKSMWQMAILQNKLVKWPVFATG